MEGKKGKKGKIAKMLSKKSETLSIKSKTGKKVKIGDKKNSKKLRPWVI